MIDRLARDLRQAFPQMGGFSRTNLLYMRAFAEAWLDTTHPSTGALPSTQGITRGSAANDFLAVRQITFKGPLCTCRPEIVGYVNGLPLAPHRAPCGGDESQ